MMRGALIGIFGILLLSTTTLGFVQTDFTDANLTLADLTNSKIQYTIFDGIHTDGCEGCP